VVQVLPLESLRWIATDAMPPPSEAVALTLTVPRSWEPGSLTVTTGALLSTRRLVTVAEASLLPARSVATERRS
jgi:hypothetical protein